MPSSEAQAAIDEATRILFGNSHLKRVQELTPQVIEKLTGRISQPTHFVSVHIEQHTLMIDHSTNNPLRAKIYESGSVTKLPSPYRTVGRQIVTCVITQSGEIDLTTHFTQSDKPSNYRIPPNQESLLQNNDLTRGLTLVEKVFDKYLNPPSGKTSHADLDHSSAP